MSKVTRFFLDTEFIERPNTIDLISIGIVCDNGKELYRINQNCDLHQASDWVRDNVLKKMPEYRDIGSFFDTSYENVVTKIKIALDVFMFIDRNTQQEGTKAEFWGYYSDYDWVALCWLFGPMICLPEGFPMFCMDIKQLAVMCGNPKLPEQGKGEHNALDDAKWNQKAYKFLTENYPLKVGK